MYLAANQVSMKGFFFFLFATIFASVATLAQSNVAATDITMQRVPFACNFFGSTATYNPPAASAVTDANAESWMRDMINRITSVAGVHNRFFLRALKSYNNCSAICFGNDIGQDRYIQFDRDFLEKYQLQTRNKWFVVGAVAHEIGHHLNGHSLDGIGSRPQKELEADEFAGFVMQKLGAPLSDAQNIFSFLNDTEGPPTHPIKQKRYSAIKKGWDKAAGLTTFETLAFDDADVRDFAVRHLAAARNTDDLNLRMKYINAALADVPEYAEAISEKGLVFLAQNKMDSAFYYTRKAIDLEPRIGLLYLNLAKVFYYTGASDQSQKALQLALKYKPILPEAYLFMGEAAMAKKDYADAALQYEVAYRMAPASDYLLAEILAGRAMARYQLALYTQAFEDISAARKLNPDNNRVKLFYEPYKTRAGK